MWKMCADRFFNEAQLKRLAELMERWRTARDQGKVFPPDDMAELEQLIDDELVAAGQRAAAMQNEIQS